MYRSRHSHHRCHPKVRRVLAAASNLDAIIEEVPYLMDPAALAQSLSNVCRWYNTQDPVSMIARNPKLLLNVEEADLEADPLYGDAIYVEDELPLWRRRTAMPAAAGGADSGFVTDVVTPP
ncbi:hypothetical protein Vretimale_2064 [Volvox reticuliferus]|nr:hypothetical protein Vretimale_2064 [Volvox reticuliferus]